MKPSPWSKVKAVVELCKAKVSVDTAGGWPKPTQMVESYQYRLADVLHRLKLRGLNEKLWFNPERQRYVWHTETLVVSKGHDNITLTHAFFFDPTAPLEAELTKMEEEMAEFQALIKTTRKHFKEQGWEIF